MMPRRDRPAHSHPEGTDHHGPAPDGLARDGPARDGSRHDRRGFAAPTAVSSPESGLADTEVLPRSFFERPSVQVAPELLGCVISHDTAEGRVALVLVEVEAYAGEADPASHAFRGRTGRNAVMYGPPGHAYVYFTYGMHYCVNLVCQPEREASAVLLRAGRVIDGLPLARARRSGAARQPRDLDLARGPARLCEALGIDRSHDGADVADPASPLRVFSPPAPVRAADISRGPRVGISRAADVAWRFWITGEPAVSPYRAHVPRRRAGAKPVTGPSRESGTMPP
jgi:DNA-3-methyladenine glycosylase